MCQNISVKSGLMQYPLQSQLVLKYCCYLGEMIVWNLRARVNVDSDLQMQKMCYLDSFSPCLLHAGVFCNARCVSGPVSNFGSPRLAAGSLSSKGEALKNKQFLVWVLQVHLLLCSQSSAAGQWQPYSLYPFTEPCPEMDRELEALGLLISL